MYLYIRSAVWELSRLLQTLETHYGAKHSSWKENGHDLNKVVANLQSTIQETLTKLKDEVYQKDRELSGLRSSTRVSSSPYRATPTKSDASNMSSVLLTPTKQPDNNALSQDAVAWQSIMSASKYASPSAPGAARLHAELLREVSI
ncbi:hypothetical protein EON65_04980 [archaeon]|nr:MAG: hypothetical protein EON65_04980 [archaeon]